MRIGAILLGIGLGLFIYHKGFRAGWNGYKNSRNMQLALDAAYRYGLYDCKH